MLTPREIDELAEAIVSGREEKIVGDMLRALVRALIADGELSVKDLALLEQAAHNARAAVNNILLANRAVMRAETIKHVEAALKKSDTGDVEVLRHYYNLAPPASSTAIFRRIGQETAEGLARIIERQNLALASNLERVWYDVAGQAITEYNHGAKTMDRIIADSVSRLTREGLKTIDYKSGIKNAPDVAIRRHVISQVAQASGRMTLMRLESYDHDLVYVPAHFGARPSHAEWHGQVYSMSGNHPTYAQFDQATGYGTVKGLLGVNCKHTFGPWFEGISEMPAQETKRDGMTSDEYYEASQHQRAFERAVRAHKRDVDLIEEVGGDATEARLKLGRAQARLRGFVKQKGLQRQPMREKAYGVRKQPRGLKRAPK